MTDYKPFGIVPALGCNRPLVKSALKMEGLIADCAAMGVDNAREKVRAAWQRVYVPDPYCTHDEAIAKIRAMAARGEL